MKIKAACSCGKKFLAKAELAGKQVKCPACGRAFTVPDLPPAAEEPLGYLLDEIGPLDASLEQTTGVLAPSRRRRSPNGNKWVVLGVAGVGLAGLVVVLVLAMAGNSARKGQDTAQDPDTIARSRSGANGDGWHAYTSSRGQCSVSMPQEPEEKGRHGVRAMAKMASGFCILEVYELPNKVPDIDAELDERMAKTLDNLQGEIDQSRSISTQGHRGRDFTYEATRGGVRLRGRCQQYIVRGLSYQLLFYSAKNKYSETDEQRFFDSFTLLEPAKERPGVAGLITGTSPSAPSERSELPDALPGERARVPLPDSLAGGGIAFSPSGDRLLVACFGGAVLLFDTATWKPIPTKGLIDSKSQKQSSAAIFVPGVELRKVAFSPDGGKAVCWGESSVAQQWDLRSARMLDEFQHPALVTHAVYSPDGRLVVTVPLYTTTVNSPAAAKKDGTYPGGMKEAWRIWDADSGKELRRCGPPLGGPVDLRFSPEGDRVYLMGSRGMACVDPATGDDIWRVSWFELGLRRMLAFDPEGERAILSVDGRLSICDLTTGKISHRLDDQPKLSVVGSATIVSPDGRWALLGDLTHRLRIWDLERLVLAGELPIRIVSKWRVAFHPSGDYWLWVDAWQLRVFDLPGPNEVVTDLTRVEPDPPLDQPSQAGQVRKVLKFDARDEGLASSAFSPDGNWIARAGATGIAVFDTSDGQPFRMRPFEGHRVPVLGLGVSGDGKTLISTDNEGAVFLWDPATGKQVASLVGHQRAVPCGALSFDGKLALTADGRTAPGPHDLVLWDVATARPLHRLQGHRHPILAAKFLDERRAVSVDMFDAALWDLETGKLSGSATVGEPGHNAVFGASFSVDGTRLLTCSSKHTRLWDLTNGKVISEIACRHAGFATPTLSHNGRLGTFRDLGSETLILHDFQNGRDLDRIPMESGTVTAAFSRDDRQLAVQHPGSFTLWAVPELEPPASESPARD